MEKSAIQIEKSDDFVQTTSTEYGQRRVSVVDDVFGEITEDGPNYRNVSWILN